MCKYVSTYFGTTYAFMKNLSNKDIRSRGAEKAVTSSLKVHKREKFIGSDFEFFTIL